MGKYKPVPIERGSYKVVRDCCQSGNCGACIGVTPYGEKMEVVQINNVSQKTAAIIAKNFGAYGARVVAA